MHTAEFFELKDTASECSMDSAYQSQSGASRRGQRKPQGQHQENRSSLSNHFVGSDVYSPSLGSDSYPTFPEPTLDMSHISHSTSTGTWEATGGPMAYANYTGGQDYAQYSSANMSQFTPSTAATVSPQWAVSETQYQSNPFTYSTYPITSNSNDMMYTASAQQQWRNTTFDTQDRPGAVRSSSSYTVQEESRRPSTQDNNFGAFVATPTSAKSVHYPHTGDYDQPRRMISR